MIYKNKSYSDLMRQICINCIRQTKSESKIDDSQNIYRINLYLSIVLIFVKCVRMKKIFLNRKIFGNGSGERCKEANCK